MKRFSLLTIIALAISVSLSAQQPRFAPYAFVSGLVSSGNGVQNPQATLGIGAESTTRLTFVDVQASFNPASSAVTGQGYQYSIQAQGYLKPFAKPLNFLMLGGGFGLTEQSASTIQYVKSGALFTRKGLDDTWRQAHPFVGVGVQFSRIRSIVTFSLPGTNGYPGEKLYNINTEYSLNKHFRLTQFTQLNDFNGSTGSVLATQVGAGLKFVL